MRNLAFMDKSKTIGPDSRTGQFTLGRGAMKKLNAVEGIATTRASDGMFRDFDRKGMSAEARRKAIVTKHTKKG